MNATDLDVIGDVLGQALAGHRKMLESLIEARTRESVTADRAVEITRSAVTEAEDRLREFLQASTSDAVLTMQRAAADEVTRLQALLLDRMKAADALTGTLQQLHADLREASAQLKDGASTYELAVQRGYAGTVDEWLKAQQGPPGGPGDAGKPGDRGPAGADGAGITCEAWAPGIHREGKTVSAYIGQYFRALRDTSEAPYGSADWERVGSAGFHLAEPYAEGRTYRPGDLFVRDFGLFLWTEEGAQLLVGRGPRGEQGLRGLAGKDGKNGRDGFSFELVELRGSVLAIVVRDADQRLHETSVDFFPVFERIAEAIEERVVERFALLAQGGA